MSESGQYKTFSTRHFPAELHYKLKLVAATLGVSQEEAFSQAMAIGLSHLEKIRDTLPERKKVSK